MVAYQISNPYKADRSYHTFLLLLLGFAPTPDNHHRQKMRKEQYNFGDNN